MSENITFLEGKWKENIEVLNGDFRFSRTFIKSKGQMWKVCVFDVGITTQIHEILPHAQIV